MGQRVEDRRGLLFFKSSTPRGIWWHVRWVGVGRWYRWEACGWRVSARRECLVTHDHRRGAGTCRLRLALSSAPACREFSFEVGAQHVVEAHGLHARHLSLTIQLHSALSHACGCGCGCGCRCGGSSSRPHVRCCERLGQTVWDSSLGHVHWLLELGCEHHEHHL